MSARAATCGSAVVTTDERECTPASSKPGAESPLAASRMDGAMRVDTRMTARRGTTAAATSARLIKPRPCGYRPSPSSIRYHKVLHVNKRFTGRHEYGVKCGQYGRGKHILNIKMSNFQSSTPSDPGILRCAKRCNVSFLLGNTELGKG